MNFKQIALAAGAVALTGMAAAFPFTAGSITFSEAPILEPGGVVVSTVQIDTTANFIDFADAGLTPYGYGNAWATQVNGDFTNYFASLNAATFFDFSYDPFTAPTKVWEATGTVDNSVNFEFYLTNVNVTEEVPGAINLFSMTGEGYLTDGVETQLGYFNLTGSSSGGMTFSWDSSVFVPEPGSMALIGLGLAGLAASRRRQKGLTA